MFPPKESEGGLGRAEIGSGLDIIDSEEVRKTGKNKALDEIVRLGQFNTRLCQ